MANQAQYAATPKVGRGSVSTADTSRTAPTNVATVFTAGASGSRIDNIDIVAAGTTVASMLRLFLHDGTNYILWTERTVAAITPSSSLRVYSDAVSSLMNPELLPLMLPTGWSLRATINDTQTGSSINVIARGGDL